MEYDISVILILYINIESSWNEIKMYKHKYVSMIKKHQQHIKTSLSHLMSWIIFLTEIFQQAQKQLGHWKKNRKCFFQALN